MLSQPALHHLSQRIETLPLLWNVKIREVAKHKVDELLVPLLAHVLNEALIIIVIKKERVNRSKETGEREIMRKQQTWEASLTPFL